MLNQQEILGLRGRPARYSIIVHRKPDARQGRSPAVKRTKNAGKKRGYEVMKQGQRRTRRLTAGMIALGLLAPVFALGGCGGVQSEAKYPTGADRDSAVDDIYAEKASVFGGDGLRVFGRGREADSSTTGIGVNSHLWRASLDTVSFMPLASADPFGGVILTDWYSPPDTPNERFKLNVFILDRELRSDGVQVKLFQQHRKGSEWRDKAAAEETARQIEDAILTRARQMRVQQMGGR